MEKSLKYLVKIVEERDTALSDIRALFYLISGTKTDYFSSNNVFVDGLRIKIIELQKENAELKAEIEQRNAVIPEEV